MAKVKVFFDQPTYTLTYVVYDANSKDAVIIDPVLNYDPASSSYSYESVDEVMDFVKSQNLKVEYILETHAHADHLTGADELRKRIPGAKVAIGSKITEVQKVFRDIYNFKDWKADGSEFDKLLEDGEGLTSGTITVKTLHTPGHTPACASYLINDKMVFTGDALFMPDFGVGRTDFPAGSAEDLYQSVHGKLYSLPDDVVVYTGHDYQPNGRELRYESTIGEEKRQNIQLKAETAKDEFIKFREGRDKTLAAPRLLLPSIQINIRGGHLPEPEDNGGMYLKIPFRSAK